MKLATFLSTLTATAFALGIAALVLDMFALPFFAAATAAMVLQIVTHEYAPGPRYAGAPILTTGKEVHPLAA